MNADLSVAIKLLKAAREEIERLKLENKSLKSDVDFLLWVANWRRYEGGYRRNFDDEEMEEAADLFDKYCKDHNREETDGKVYHVINKVVVETLQ